MSQGCDILVVGGGAIGLSAAGRLARRRAGQVILLEKSFFGAGGSGKSAGLLYQHDGVAVTAAMARGGLRFYAQLHESLGSPPVFTPMGMVLVVRASDREALDGNLAAQREAGVDVRPISGQELTEIDANARLSDEELARLRGGGWLRRSGAGADGVGRLRPTTRGRPSPRRRGPGFGHRQGQSCRRPNQ